MKVRKLTVKNIGLLADVNLDLDKPLILFFGQLRQGKTTVLNSVKMCFGGSYPSDVIRHGEQEASISLEFDNGSITREFYRNKEGKVADRPIVFILDGKTVKRPVDEIKKFLNPFLLDSEHFMKMRELDRKVFLTELFHVDTSDLDAEQATIESEGRDLRSTIKAYGVIDTTPVVLLDAAAAEAELAKIKSDHAIREQTHRETVSAIQTDHRNKAYKADTHNLKVEQLQESHKRVRDEILKYGLQIEELQKAVTDRQKWLSDNPLIEAVAAPQSPVLPNPPGAPDTSALEVTIRQGEANKVLHAAYQERLKSAAKKTADEKRLSDIEAKWRELKKAKIARLKEIDTGGIKELSFDENGNFTYQDVQAGMLSTSQIMKLSGELSGLYPAGFGLELIDRAESLGKSIFAFVERAQREEKSILATIVGERPAEVPENVGVWVVEEGAVKA